MTDFPPLEPNEAEIPASDELLFRQVTTNTWNEKARVPSSLAFGPMPVDEGKPSLARSSVVTAQESRDWHTKNARSPSLGVWAVTAREVVDEESRSVDDAKVEPTEGKSPGHCFVDYRNLDKPTRKELRGALLAKALERHEIPTISSS